MKYKLVFLGFVFLAQIARAQNDTVYSFTLNEALEFAMLNNNNIENAELDMVKAKKKVWETTAGGLPQVEAKGAYSYWLTVPQSIEQFSSLGSMGQAFGDIYSQLNYFYSTGQLTAPSYLPGGTNVIPQIDMGEPSSTDDMRTNLTLDLSVSQLIFSGSYIVGLQASKTYKKLSELSYDATKNDLKESVTNAYFLTLIMKENLNLINETALNNKKIYEEYKIMFDNGLVQKTDLDQFKLVFQSLENTTRKISRQFEDAKRLLKYHLGVDFSDSLFLKDSLSGLVDNYNLSIAMTDFDIENNTTYKQLQNQEKISELNLKLMKSETLPYISAFYNHQENFNENSFTFTPPDMVGVNVSVPIFSSFQRVSKISQAKIDLKQTRLMNEYYSNGLEMEFQSARATYLSAYDNFENERDNLELSKTIYNNNLERYEQGLISSIELTQAQNQYLSSQTSYFNAIVDLVSAKTKIDKLKN